MHTVVCKHAYKCIYQMQQTISNMAPQVLFKQQYPIHNYEVRTELIENQEPGAKTIEVQRAYTISGACIGDRITAEYLCETRDISPELATHKSTVCSIGFCKREQKWYGWSRLSRTRIKGFGIGSTSKHMVGHPAQDSDIPYRKRPLRPKQTPRTTQAIMEKWTAKTLDDARQMAVDFATLTS